MEYQDLVSLAPWTIIVQIINLFIQAALFRRFLLRPVQKILSERAQQVQKTYDEAEAARRDADAAKQQHEAQLAALQQQTDELVQAAREKAVRQAQSILDSAERSARQLRRSTDAELRRQRGEALEQTREEIAQFALALAGKIVEKKLDPARHRVLIDHAIAELEEEL